MVVWTVLTAILFLVLLGFLAWALQKIDEALQGVGKSLQKIAWGVRAIEVETNPLPPGISGVAAALTDIAGGLTIVRDHLGRTTSNLPGAARTLGLIP